MSAVDTGGKGINFGSVDLNVSGTPGKTLTVYVTEQNIDSPLDKRIRLDTTLTENALPKGWRVNEYSFYDTENRRYTGSGTGTLIGTQNFTSAGTYTNFTLADFTTDYSLTEVYLITLSGTAARGSDLSTITIQANVPEASTWAMMLLGFAGLGLAGYRSSRKAVSIDV